MTMLDRMRRHKAWLKWSLGLVVLAFVIFYIPDFLTGATADPLQTGAVATVEGREITANEFRRTYQAQLEAYRNAYGASMNEQLLKQLGIDQQILQQMVDERAALAEADRLGISVNNEEVRQRILTMPAFQQNGQFIGQQLYQQLLRSQRPPMTPAEFEDNVRRGIAVDKLRMALTSWVAIPDGELEAEYRRRNDQVKLSVVALMADSFRGDVTATDAEVSTYFDAHAADFTHPREAEDPLRARGRGRHPFDHHDSAGRRRSRLQRGGRPVHDARADPRQPHPAVDDRQGRSHRAGEGRGDPRAGEGRGGLRRARQTVFGRRGLGEERRRPRLLRAGPHGAGVRAGGVRPRARSRSATS